MCGFIAQLVEHRTGIAEVMGSNPVEALIFKIYWDDHTSLRLFHLQSQYKYELLHISDGLNFLKIETQTSFVAISKLMSLHF